MAIIKMMKKISPPQRVENPEEDKLRKILQTNGFRKDRVEMAVGKVRHLIGEVPFPEVVKEAFKATR